MEDSGAVCDYDFWNGNVVTEHILPGTADAVLDPDGNTRYIAVFAGIPPGEDFESGLGEFIIYGRYSDSDRPNLGRSIIRNGVP